MTMSRGATRVVAICSICSGLGAALGFLPGFIATTFRDDLGISKGQIGLLVGLYFGCTGLGSIMGGRLTDRFGARAVVVADMVSVTIAGAFAAAVGTYWSLLVAAIIGGSGYALVNAGTNVAMAHAVPIRRRTLAMSVKTAGRSSYGGDHRSRRTVGCQPLELATRDLGAGHLDHSGSGRRRSHPG